MNALRLLFLVVMLFCLPEMQAQQDRVEFSNELLRSSRQNGGSTSRFLVSSPDGNSTASLKWNRSTSWRKKITKPQRMFIEVKHKGASLLKDKQISICVKSRGRRYTFGKAEITEVLRGENLVDTNGEESPSVLSGRYNRIVIKCEDDISLEVRMYNEGVAYRFIVEDFPEDYKILQVADVFPADKGLADYGTFEGRMEMPWRAMLFPDDDEKCLSVADESYEKVTKLLSWKDALSSASIGAMGHNYIGYTWPKVGMDWGASFDFTYKYLYGGFGFTTCQQIMYILYEEWLQKVYPFENVCGPIHAWTLTGRLGASIPIQVGYNIWNISPYCAFSYLKLTQHKEEMRPLCDKPDPSHRYMVGPGIRVQVAMRERLVLGFNYEFQFFTSPVSPVGKSSFGLSLGWLF